MYLVSQLHMLIGHSAVSRREYNSSGFYNFTYVFEDQQNLLAHVDVITCTLSIFSNLAYALIDRGSMESLKEHQNY